MQLVIIVFLEFIGLLKSLLGYEINITVQIARTDLKLKVVCESWSTTLNK